MGRPFNPKAAKQLTDKHQELLQQLFEVSELSKQYASDSKILIHKLIDRNVFADQIRREVIYNQPPLSINPGIRQLLLDLYLYKMLQPVSQASIQLIELNKSRLMQEINNLAPGNNNLRWLFTSSKSKLKASEAFEYLKEQLEGDYGSTARGIITQAEDIKKESLYEADFEHEREYYKSLLQQIDSDVMSTATLILELSTILKEYTQLEQTMKSAEESIEESNKEISEAANRWLTQEVLAVLRGIPIEEVNRDKGGLRIKALREYGYTTMADIYVSNVYQLATVRGISADTAFVIKHISEHYAAQAKSTCKIRISADQKTKEATMIVKAIYAYRQKVKYVNEMYQLNRSHRAEANRSITEIKKIGNGVPWLFYSDHAKETAISAYQCLNSLLHGEYAKKINELIDLLSYASSADSVDAWKDFELNPIQFFNVLEEIVPGVLGNSDSIYGLPEDLAREIQDESFFPEGLLCTLRRYQEWGVKYILHQERVLLGDEMGLGKTVQAIATMVSLRNTGATHFVVVCPASVLANWCREISKQSKLRVTKVHGTDRIAALHSWVKTGGVAVTTFETTAYFKLADGFNLDLLVVDEAHYIKNPNAIRSINIKKLTGYTQRLLFMTGTALENKVDEMIALIQILQPQIASEIKPIAFMSSASQFREKIAPVYYRRKREQVLTELPDLIESKEWCTLSHVEEAIYERSVLAKNYADARRVSWNVNDLKDSCKARRLIEIVDEARSEGRKVLVFSFFLDTIRKISISLGRCCMEPISGSVRPQRRQEIIDEFDSAPAGTVLVAQIQSGGTGLNIQSASVVVLCEPQFKPSIENQAISRAYRMGQARNVLVYRLLCENTVDERIVEMLEQKQAVFDAFADKSVAANKSMELDDKTFGKIIEEEIERINTKHGNRPNRQYDNSFA